jgi:Flp pilus assembly pilin Flp
VYLLLVHYQTGFRNLLADANGVAKCEHAHLLYICTVHACTVLYELVCTVCTSQYLGIRVILYVANATSSSQSKESLSLRAVCAR